MSSEVATSGHLLDAPDLLQSKHDCAPSGKTIPRIRTNMGSDPVSYRYNLGTFRRKVTTSSGPAQTWFDRALSWCYAFHHEESARCFERAIEADGKCAMAYWGVSK